MHSLRFRLLLAFLTVVIVAVGVAVALANRRTTAEFQGYVVRNFQQDQQTVAFLLEQEIQREGVTGAKPLVQAIGQAYGWPITLADAQGDVIFSSALPPGPVLYDNAGNVITAAPFDTFIEMPVDSSTIPVEGALWQEPVIFMIESAVPATFNQPTEQGFTVQIIPSPSEDVAFTSVAPPPGIIYRGVPANNEQLFLGSVNQSFLIAALAAVVVAGLLSLGVSQRILEPVEALTAAARQMEKGDLSQRVVVTRQDEIGTLAHAFNAMADGLQRMEQLRRSMVTDIAHELRTPLSNIRGYLEALQDGVLQPDAASINSLHEEALLLNRLIEDLQELSLAEAGRLRLNKQKIQPDELIRQAVNSVLPQANEHQLTITADLLYELPTLSADPERIGQVLRNLLHNAITHTPPGGVITISAVNREEPSPLHPFTPSPYHLRSPAAIPPPLSPSAFIQISIRDTGSGIPPEHLPHIFDRFYRADPSRQRATGGTGLGLTIVKALVEMHNGRIWVESNVEQGTTFSFTLPL